MLILRDETFIKKDGKIFFVGSSSNRLYQNLCKTMGDITVLGWLKNQNNYYTQNLEEFIGNEHIVLKLYDDHLPLREKLKIINREVRQSTCIDLKMPLKDALFAYPFVRKARKPYVIESGTDPLISLWYHGGIKFKVCAVPLYIINKIIHRNSKYVIYVSKHYLQKRYKTKAVQIGCPDVILDEPSVDVLNNRLKRIHRSSNNAQYILGLIGSTNAEYRGHDELIRVMKTLRDKGYNVTIRFLGGGTKDEDRKQLARKLDVLQYVEFSGRLPHDQVLDWIDQIDMLVMPTLAETLGRSIVEAMSRGCPIIGSIGTAIEEQIGADCIVSPRNTTEIVHKIEELIQNKQYMEYCAYENFYRSYKYTNAFTNIQRKLFFDRFYKETGLEMES